MRIILAGVPDIVLERLRPALATRHQVSVLDGDPRDRASLSTHAACDVLIQGYPDSREPLAAIDTATRGTWNVLTTIDPRRYIQLSSMRLFDSYSPGWAVNEQWLPRPTTTATDLSAYLAELTARELCRTRRVDCVVLRLDKVVAASDFQAPSIGRDWLHLDDAVAAIVRATECPELPQPESRWRPLHVVRGDRSGRFPLGAAAEPPFGFIPEHTCSRQESQISGLPLDRPVFPARFGPLTGLTRPERVTVFGAGGPLSAAMVAQLGKQHRLLLTDVRPLAHFAAAPPQSPGAPRPGLVSGPDREAIVDITDPDAVLTAAREGDCLVNCAVVRHDPVLAFRVNVLGAYNTMSAAIQCGIRRVVHTGPALTLMPYPVGYQEDREVGGTVPSRPGDNLYFLTKFLAQEICRLFAEEHQIACPVLLYCGFVNLDTVGSHRPHPFSVSWDDAGRAMAAAVRVAALPEPSPVLHVLADSPHGHYSNDETRDVLNWEPEDRLDHLWYRA